MKIVTHQDLINRAEEVENVDALVEETKDNF